MGAKDILIEQAQKHADDYVKNLKSDPITLDLADLKFCAYQAYMLGAKFALDNFVATDQKPDSIKLPDYMDIREKSESPIGKEEMTPMDWFILNNEPAGYHESENFRDGLLALIKFVCGEV